MAERKYEITSTGVNVKGNHYEHRDYGPFVPNRNSYRYLNSGGGEFHSNPNGSRYYVGKWGNSWYEPPGHVHSSGLSATNSRDHSCRQCLGQSQATSQPDSSSLEAGARHDATSSENGSFHRADDGGSFPTDSGLKEDNSQRYVVDQGHNPDDEDGRPKQEDAGRHEYDLRDGNTNYGQVGDSEDNGHEHDYEDDGYSGYCHNDDVYGWNDACGYGDVDDYSYDYDCCGEGDGYY
ncbi:hypothetical protein LTR24_010370 [Lithohypha guttulata]|uniref:Uncharacterized protein n=1 Tax=Lithohypha guttulata TaxID=1690604 RepID=A0ABR0JUK1_9EURO|nr:hypothetical protein LTR24_010370 [Lithohypha guttulata]